MISDNTTRLTFAAQVRLTGEGLVLREWTDADLPVMAELFDDRDIAYWTPLASPFDAAAARAYLARARQARADGMSLRLAITADGALPLGEVLLFRKNPDDPAVSLGYTVGSAHRGQRLGSRALRLLTDYAHHDLGLPRVTLGIATENAASISVARSAGYHPTDEPPLDVVTKGRPRAIRTWAHDCRD
ncbi:GNAT family N-acetyltransferase [Streptomyces sp. NBC_00620]|uniref:GNAT family N-acetyltransferase n=1 Tax=Streptomyces sp. NBC_00620 TaxID=2903666 RepID=UPI00224F887E|nr:GNAT family N-acetyltransferase [Streptomyces sp. NBC_00620]MCX4978346.1 GNAT family N-acetyltransferase [Streptomyces sp. NBC_00620]